MVRARALKRAGDPYGSAKAMDTARSLDGQDRFVNTKTGKYLLRAGMPERADVILYLFTKVREPYNVFSSHSFVFGHPEGYECSRGSGGDAGTTLPCRAG